MQFISIRIESNGKIDDLYFEYGAYHEELWQCTLCRNNRQIIRTFSHPLINSCFKMLSEFLSEHGKITAVTGLSNDIVFPELLSSYLFKEQHIDPGLLAMAS